ncbi:hypothetical protein [Shinella sp.]|uniref:hypothetical protein n=1 Tax=Shinella sp. TaxID=1870904 RepID=UPI0039E4E2B4
MAESDAYLGGGRMVGDRDWFMQGCDRCRQGILSGKADNPELIVTSVRMHAHLRRCWFCAAWWEDGEREAHVVEEREARVLFPEAFDG